MNLYATLSAAVSLFVGFFIVKAFAPLIYQGFAPIVTDALSRLVRGG